ncbi:hypothetical protein EDC01DRAFT_619207 [Geopyxis carbonaria]|nr:hypothetical protein EDC01DRAFT_619207 [Geopyxis carbonaria]
MHRLRTRKKTKGATDDDIPPVPILSSKTFFSKSKATPPPKEPEIDLDSVLPSSDDFRTSLLMPNLANRFSILKMQEAAAAAAAAGTPSQYDALNLEIGVGISDPDYNPKRFIGLGDIAETDSITGSMTSRFTSVSEDAGRDSEDGTVMNRPRGGEGNVLFGGRQKVYRVPASSALRGGTTSMEDLRGGGGSLGARAVYDHDLPDTRSKHNRDSEHDSEGNGDQTEFNKNRFTTSSTNSTPASMTRSSTAATSINSQTGHSGTQASNSTPQSPTISSKPRRPLYEQALDQQLQDQQTTALSRLERLASLRKLGAASPPPGSESPVSGSASVLVSPVSPSTKQTMPWSSKRASPHSPLSPSAEDYQERTSTTTEEPVKPSGIEKFDFGLGSGSLSPISPPLSSKSNEFPTRGPFSPGALTGDILRFRSPPATVARSEPSDRRVPMVSSRVKRKYPKSWAWTTVVLLSCPVPIAVTGHVTTAAVLLKKSSRG